jgi:hypothetical protein
VSSSGPSPTTTATRTRKPYSEVSTRRAGPYGAMLFRANPPGGTQGLTGGGLFDRLALARKRQEKRESQCHGSQMLTVNGTTSTVRMHVVLWTAEQVRFTITKSPPSAAVTARVITSPLRRFAFVLRLEGWPPQGGFTFGQTIPPGDTCA